MPVRLPAHVALLIACLAAPAWAQTASVSVFKTGSPDPVDPGASLVYTVTVSNEGPDDAANLVLDDPLPTGTTFQSLAAPAGWSCSTPAVGVNGTISCSVATLPPGSAVFTITVQVDAGVAVGTVLSNTVTATSTTPDRDNEDNTFTATTTVGPVTPPPPIVKTDDPDPVLAGNDVTYTITVNYAGPAQAETASVADTLPAGTTFVSLAPESGWSCITPAVGSGGTVTCTIAPLDPGRSTFTLVVATDPSIAGGTVLQNQASFTFSADGRDVTRDATATTTVLAPTSLAATKTVQAFVSPGGSFVYRIVVTNTSPHFQPDLPGDELVDVLPPEVVLTGASATAGTVSANLGASTVTWNGPLAGGASVVITIAATVKASVPVGAVVTNQGTLAYDGDGNGSNEATALTDDPTKPGEQDATAFEVVDLPVPALGPAASIVLVLLLAVTTAVLLRRPE
jgi:uncharacterized repeat protein (TIGR01451 family)